MSVQISEETTKACSKDSSLIFILSHSRSQASVKNEDESKLLFTIYLQFFFLFRRSTWLWGKTDDRLRSTSLLKIKESTSNWSIIPFQNNMTVISTDWGTNWIQACIINLIYSQRLIFNERIFVYNFSWHTDKNSLDAERLQFMRKSYITFWKEDELLRASRK